MSDNSSVDISGGVNFLGSFMKMNPFAKHFQKNRQDDINRFVEQEKNSQGTSVEDVLTRSQYNVSDENGNLTVNISFNPNFANKESRINNYRSMANYPAISQSIDAICDDAVLPDIDGKICSLEFKKELPEHIEDTIRKYWDYIVDDVINISDTGWDLFRKWLIDGELFIELVLNDDADSVIGIKILPPFTMYPIYHNDEIVCYVQSLQNYGLNGLQSSTIMANLGENKDVMFDVDQILYINYSDFAGTSKIDICGFLENSIRSYNQLRNLEDAVVVNKIVRAPTRRLWNVDVGMMTKTKGDAYIQGVIQRIKKNIQYDPSTGVMNSNENFMAVTEDFWFAKNAEGRGTTVENIDGTNTFDDMGSVNYFLKRLYESMKIPSSRWKSMVTEGQTSTYSGGKSNEITREEIEFSKLIKRFQNKFKYLLLDALIVQLRMSGVDERYCNHNLFNVRFNKTNLFETYKELEVLEARAGVLQTMDSFVYKPGENELGYFDREFMLKKFFMMNDEDYNENLYLLNRSKNNIVNSEDSKENIDDQSDEIMDDESSQPPEETSFDAETQLASFSYGDMKPTDLLNELFN